MPNFSELTFFFEKYFPGRIGDVQIDQFRRAFEAYVEWNEKINVISRKDMQNLAERHFLHSLAIAKHIEFKAGTQFLDAGTGGGFPGIPLAIFFPECEFRLVDSRNKKIKVVEEIVQAAALSNVQFSVQRVEDVEEQFDFVLSRAVASMDKFIPWVHKRIHCRSQHKLRNGILYLRGGNPKEEMQALKSIRGDWKAWSLGKYFDEEFFDTKYLLHWSDCRRSEASGKKH